MSAISFPYTLIPAKFSWGQMRQDVEFRSTFGAQAVEVSTPLWLATITSPVQVSSDSTSADSGAWQSLFMKLKGRTNQLALHNYGRPEPLGTMRGTMTLNSSASAGATALSIVASGQTSKTLLAGDLIGIGSTTTQQVVMITADATSNGSGVIAVNIEPPLRNAFTSGAAVTWDKPQVLFRLKSTSSNKWEYDSINVSGLMFDLIEDWRT